MPSKKAVVACIHCGMPSDTVVCMSCFFKYKSEPCDLDPNAVISNPCVNRSEYKPKFKSEFLSEYEPEFVQEFQEDDEPTSWLQEEFASESQLESKLEPEIKPELEKKEEEKPEKDKNSPVSWFSRLPRF